MAEDLRVRPMRAFDVERVQEIAKGLSEAPHWPDAAYVAAIDNSTRPARIALVAEIHTTTVVGFAVSQFIPPEAELETIAVAPDAQRYGVGRKMFLELTERLRAERVTAINLEVRVSNAMAIEFYRALGFRETGRRPRYYSLPQEDALLMCLRVR